MDICESKFAFSRYGAALTYKRNIRKPVLLLKFRTRARLGQPSYFERIRLGNRRIAFPVSKHVPVGTLEPKSIHSEIIQQLAIGRLGGGYFAQTLEYRGVANIPTKISGGASPANGNRNNSLVDASKQ